MFERFLQSTVQVYQDLRLAFTSKLFPAEPYFHVFNATIPAVIGSVLNNQAMNVRLDYDIYVYAICITSESVFDFLIKQAGGGVLYSNAQIRSSVITAPALGMPWFPLYRLWKIPASTDLVVDLTNVSSAGETIPLQITLAAWKGRPQNGPQENNFPG